MSTSKGRGAAAHAIAEVIPPEQLRFLFLRPSPNHAIEFDPDGHRPDPAPVRRVRQVRRRDGRPRGQGRAAARLRGHLPLLAAGSGRGRRGRGGRVPAGVLAPRAAGAGPRRRRRGARSRRRRGAPSTERERAILDERVGAARGLARRRTRPSARSSRSSRPCRRRPRTSTGEQRAFLAALADAAADARLETGDAWQDAIFRTAASSRHRRAGRAFAALYRAFLGRPNGPRAGWLLASWTRPSSSSACVRPAAHW